MYSSTFTHKACTLCTSQGVPIYTSQGVAPLHLPIGCTNCISQGGHNVLPIQWVQIQGGLGGVHVDKGDALPKLGHTQDGQ